MSKLVLPLVALLLAGCADTEFRRAYGAPQHEKYAGEVKLLDRFPEAGTYERLGIVFARGVGLTERDTLIEQVKAEAAKQGANAVVLQGGVKVRKTQAGGEEKILGAFALRLKP